MSSTLLQWVTYYTAHDHMGWLTLVWKEKTDRKRNDGNFVIENFHIWVAVSVRIRTNIGLSVLN